MLAIAVNAAAQCYAADVVAAQRHAAAAAAMLLLMLLLLQLLLMLLLMRCVASKHFHISNSTHTCK